jgi:Antibiotic biosynthesis monooxygenase
MYQAIRIYNVLPGSTEAFLQRVQENFVPLIRQQAGFIAYDAQLVGTNRVRSISTFETQAEAESSVLLALRWVQEHSLELVHGLPRLQVGQSASAGQATAAPHTCPNQADKRLVLDLTYEVLHPAALGERASSDPQVCKMVSDVRNFLAQMWADSARRDQVIYRFGEAIRPEAATRGLYAADHVILVRRAGQLAGYLEINREADAWWSRERFEGDILVDPAAYHRDAAGQIVEKGIGVQGLLEMRRQAHMLGFKDLELDVYQHNQPMHHFLDHLIATQRLPFTKHGMQHGGPFDHTYHLTVA